MSHQWLTYKSYVLSGKTRQEIENTIADAVNTSDCLN